MLEKWLGKNRLTICIGGKEYDEEFCFFRLKSFVTQRAPFDVKNPYLSKIVVNRNLHSDDSDRYCMHIELDIADSRIRYDAGDHVAIYPKNDSELVNRIGELLGINLVNILLTNTKFVAKTFPNPKGISQVFSHKLI